MSYSNLHSHSDYSNASCGFPDSICSVEQLVLQAAELGMHGIALTDHDILAGSVKMHRLQDDYPDMKLIIGNEIYCMSEAQHAARLEGTGDTPYYHLILIALDITGWHQLCKLSTFAWSNGFYSRGNYRRITTKEYIESVVGEDPGHIICSSACMGGEVAAHLKAGNWNGAREMIAWCQRTFGKDNYFLEIQPNEKGSEQCESNKKVIALARSLNIPLIATTDAHMLSKSERVAHAAAKNSKFSEDAEGEDFYATAYLMSEDELRHYLRNDLSDEEIDEVITNTNAISDRVVGYNGMLRNQVIPEIPEEYIPEFEVQHIFKDYYDKYKYLKMFSEKDYLQERYAFYQIETGLKERVADNPGKAERLEDYIARIDHELEIVAAIDDALDTKVLTYYSTYAFMMDEIWKLGSVVAVGRGSACSWLINYIIGANQIDPIDAPMQEMLFPERHLNKLRFELPDCDYDSSPMYRKRIIERFKEIWGEDNFLQVATFGTLGPKAVLKRACKGLDIDDDVAEKMSTLVPTDRGVVRPLSVCLDPAHPMRIQELITEVAKHPGLKEILLRLEGVIISMGSHAGGICPYTEPYVEQLAAVRSPRGVMQTCFDLHDAEATGTTKFDNLTTTATELIRKEIELLVRDGYIEWAGNLRDTYESVIGVDNLEYEDSQMWEKVLDVPQMFQFETPIGINILKKIQPKKIEELCAASSLMRLLPQGMSEVPADRYLRYREDVENFRRDARNCGLNAEEIQVIEDVCAPDGYMTLHQETLMLLSMHPKVAGFTYKEANKLRKSVAKKDPQAQQEVKDMFYEWCENAGTRQVFASYVWNEMFAAQMGYSFSVPHVLAYGLVALQELNLFHRFPKEYWYASILDTEGIASDESSGGGTDYSKITKAIYLLRNANVNVDAPLINNADNEFGIDVENHKILYALSAIPLINDDDVEVIKAQRPYRNLLDFVDRSNFNKSKVINLIKAGSFGDPVKRMKTYAGILALKNMPSKFGITLAKKYMNALRDETMAGNMLLITMLKDPANMLGTQGSKKVYLLPPEYIGLCADLKYEQDWWDDGDQTCITNTGIDKAMKKEMTEIKEFVKTEEFITNYWECMRDDIYNELVGDKPDPIRWEFDATSYYHTHNIFSQELLDEQEWFNFDEMPEDPVYEVKEGRRGTWHEYALYSMPITVIGKNDIRHNIMGLTADNKVVSIRMLDGEYAHYKKSTKAEKSWFTRGNLLLLHGYRQGDEFRLKKYTSSPFNHTIYKINDLDGMSVELQSERLADE